MKDKKDGGRLRAVNDKEFPKRERPAQVDAEHCDGCGFCVDVCPRQCLELVPNAARPGRRVVKVDARRRSRRRPWRRVGAATFSSPAAAGPARAPAPRRPCASRACPRTSCGSTCAGRSWAAAWGPRRGENYGDTIRHSPIRSSDCHVQSNELRMYS